MRVNMKKIFNLYKTVYTKIFGSVADFFGEEWYKVIGAIVLLIALAVTSITVPIIHMKSIWAVPVILILQAILIPIYYALFNYADKKL